MNKINSENADNAWLLMRIEEGDRAAFNIIYERYWNTTFTNAYKRLHDEDEARNVVQEIFLNLWIRRGQPIENLAAYLSIAVRNQVYKVVEKQKLSTPFLDVFESISSPNDEADRNILWQEFYSYYETLLTALPPKRQLIFRLRFHEDKTTKAIAEHMGISRKTVQNQLGKAIEQLRMVLLSFFYIKILLRLVTKYRIMPTVQFELHF